MIVAADFTRAEKHARNLAPLPKAIRELDRIWGRDFVDVSILVAKALLSDPSADVDALVAGVRRHRRAMVIRNGRDLAEIARGAA